EVKDTLPRFAVLSGLFLVPLFLVNLAGTIRKARAQIALLRAAGALTSRTRLDAIARAAAILSSFLVRRFSADLLARGAVVSRRFEPGVARAGDLARDVLDLKGVPVPPGFFLKIEGKLPPRLATEVRHVVPPKPRDERLSLDVLLKRTPRGTY